MGAMFEKAKLCDFAPGAGIEAGAQRAAFDDREWIDVAIPGDVHRALIAAGRIADPFYDHNEALCAWMEEREWWYRIRFDHASGPAGLDERLRLILYGLDTFVTIWLNGHELGRHANMFTPAEFDLTALVAPGPNTLAILFDRPLDHLEALEGIPLWGRNQERVAMRKAQFGYGWDWGPRLPTIGVWLPIALKHERYAVIEGVHISTLEIEREARRAAIAVRVEADHFAEPGPLVARVRLLSPDSVEAASGILVLPEATRRVSGTLYLTVEQPRLWWTHDLGEPALYAAEITLEAGGRHADNARISFGIRTLTLDQAPDQNERGTRFFRFVLNGVPLFAKGADWIPADSFVGALTAERYEPLIEQARAGRMNMLRVWGGGLYEHDAFYDQCDRRGLLVWHDFMFACAPYPDTDPGFRAEVEAEARYQVRRLRNHPCMALWCGNNENNWIYEKGHWDQPDAVIPGHILYSEILPAAVAREDGRTPYWPSSPYGGNDYNSFEDGNAHDWFVWHGMYPRRFGEPQRREYTVESVSYLRYADNMGRFISEFGIHAAPVLQTLRTVIPEDQLFHHSPAMDQHNKDNPKNKGDLLMLSVTGVPETLEQYIDFSMIAQAEGLKFGVEHFRRRMPHCSGTLVWQLNDCWPVQSWSILDYYGVGKAGYFYLRRAFTPVLASFKALPDGSVELWITNDTRDRFDAGVSVCHGAFSGAPHWEERIATDVAPQTSTAIQRWTPDRFSTDLDSYLAVRSTDARVEPNRHFFGAIKDLRRVKPDLTHQIAVIGRHELRVEVETAEYAYFVHLLAPDPATRFSDNYLDILPGERLVITVTNHQSSVRPEDITLRWL
jgi:beta-mannosidase